VAVAAVAAYVIFCGASRFKAIGILEAEAESLKRKPDFTYVFPEPFGPHRWKGVLREGNTYWIYLIHSLTGRIELKQSLETAEEEPIVEVARTVPLIQRIEWFFKAPVWSVEENSEDGPTEIKTYDLRFKPLLIKRRAIPFVYRFLVYPDGRVERLRD